eukprot:Skav236485  [mRNA]  locus=scaffold1440:211779:214709:+ [translate_table: standard]
MEVASSVKKEPAVGVEVKRERIDEREGRVEGPQTEIMEMDDLWLQVKLEINEEMEREMRLSSVDTDDMHGVRIKEEFADESHQDFKSFQSQCLNLEDDEVVGRVQQQSSTAPQVQRIVEPGNKPVAKRRRLTRLDWPKTLQREVANSVKKEPAGGVKIKKERIDEREAILESPEKKNQISMEMDDLWLQVHKEIKKQCSGQLASANSSAGNAMKTSLTALEPRSWELEEAEGKFRGLDCMKMWPWMRDLPTGVWAGRGWAFDENGLRRLSSTGGSAAMKGVELFESIGAAEVAASGEKTKETAVAGSASEPAAQLEGQKPSRFLRHNSVKQSGVPNVKWNRVLVAWEVNFPRVDSKGKRIGKTNRVFAVKKFLVPGRTEAEADAEALEAAKAFRAELVLQGVLSEPKPRDPNFTSEVPGVAWKKELQKWKVQIPPKHGKKRICGGCFTEKAAAEAKALELREAHGLERQVTAVSTLAELPVFHPKVPYLGVNWEQRSQQWLARWQVGGANRHFHVKPKDHSEEELERSFKVAVTWRKKHEKEKGNAAKPKVQPVKKQRK